MRLTFSFPGGAHREVSFGAAGGRTRVFAVREPDVPWRYRWTCHATMRDGTTADAGAEADWGHFFFDPADLRGRERAGPATDPEARPR